MKDEKGGSPAPTAMELARMISDLNQQAKAAPTKPVVEQEAPACKLASAECSRRLLGKWDDIGDGLVFGIEVGMQKGCTLLVFPGVKRGAELAGCRGNRRPR